MKYLLLLPLLLACGKERTQKVYTTEVNSCYTQQESNGVKIICKNSETFIPNGVDGTDGTDGVNGTNGQDGQDSPQLEYVEICPTSGNVYPEILVKLTSNGNSKYLAFLDGSNKRLVVLTENTTFVTTDGRSKLFRIENGNITCL